MVEKDLGIENSSDADLIVHQIATDWRLAALSDANRMLCSYAEKLSGCPQQMVDADISELRDVGFTDQGIHDATQVISYFNYINRVADGLGIDLESSVHAWEQSVPS